MDRGFWRALLAATIACGAQPREQDGTAQARAQPQQAAPPTVQTGPEIQQSAASLSPPLRDMTPAPRRAGPPRENVRPGPLPRPAPDLGTGAAPEPPLPFALAPVPAIPAPLASFEGIGNGFTGPGGTFTVNSAPPDTNGAVGPNHYVQMVNTELAVFNKTGTVLLGPVPINTVWSGFPGNCSTSTDGDPIVLYDRMADRWIVSQFAVAASPFLECVAVSQTGDPTGAYHRYSFSYGTSFPDYPKLAVWPDAYYVTYNMFNSAGTSFLGAKVCALDRASMLAGLAATQQCFNTTTSFGGLLASDLEGPRLPAAGAPNLVVGLGTTATTLAWWKFHVDWTTPANSTFTGPTTLTIPTYTQLCAATGTCIPQLGTGQQLDSLGDRLMHRLSYRNLGSYESFVVNHAIVGPSGGGAIRWYELRSLATPTLAQSGTHAPDASYRWMGSIAQDAAGDLAVGYSVSSSAMTPAIRYTGRAWNAAAGTMDQGEGTIFAGAGAQTATLSRWGDYSAMTVDPADDCTFWYTNEYIPANGTFNWKTRIASFRLPNCPPKMAASAPAATVHSPVTVTFTAQDQLGNTLTWYTGSAGLASGAAGATFPASVTFTAGVATASVTFVTVGASTITATDPTDPAHFTATATVTVNPGPAASLVLTGLPASTTAGTALSATITAKDAWNNTATGYAGTAGVTSSDPQATIPATVTFAAGVATLPATLRTAGSRSVTATDSGNAALTVTGSVQVNPAAAAAYAFTGLPASATAGTVVAGGVAANDAYGNLATGYAGTAQVASNDPQATLPASLSFTAGVAPLSATLRTAGTRTLTVTDVASSAVTGSTSVQVSPGALAAYGLGGLPASAAAGAALSGTVTAQDAYGNAVASYSGTGNVTSSDPQATVPASVSFTAGVASLSATLRTAGTRTVTVTDSVASTVAGSASVQVLPGAAAGYALAGIPASATAGTALSGTLTAHDAFGNTATGYGGTAHVSTSDPQATVPATVAFTAGAATLPATLKTAGTQSVTATDAATVALTATASVAVSPAAAAAYAVTVPTAPPAGTPVDLAVAVRDAFGNAVPAYAGTGHVTSSDPQATLPADLVFTAGAAAAKITFRTAGAQTVTVTDVAQPSVTGGASVTVPAADTGGGGSGGGCGCGSAAPSDLAGLLLGLAALWRGGRARAGRPRAAGHPQG